MTPSETRPTTEPATADEASDPTPSPTAADIAHATWTRIDVAAASTGDRRTAIETLVDTAPSRHLFHSFAWLVDSAPPDAAPPALFALERDDRLLGYAPFLTQPWALRYRIGELTFWKRPLTRLALLGGALYPETLGADARIAATRSLLETVRASLPKRHVVFMEGIPLDQAGDYEGAGFHVVRYGAPFPHHSIEMPDAFADYMQRLSKRTREGLRRNRRKLVKSTSDGLTLDVVTSGDAIDRFVDDAVEVSKKTYQWTLLGLGLRDAAGLKQTMHTLAKHDMTCCFMLRVEGEAVAFMIGYRRADTYYYIDVGFDPDWTKQSVGTILHMDAIEHLIENETGVRYFDFSTGTGTHKERFGTTSRTETNLLLVPKGLRGAALSTTYRASDAFSSKSSALLERLKVKDTLKKWLRRRASGTS